MKKALFLLLVFCAVLHAFETEESSSDVSTASDISSSESESDTDDGESSESDADGYGIADCPKELKSITRIVLRSNEFPLYNMNKYIRSCGRYDEKIEKAKRILRINPHQLLTLEQCKLKLRGYYQHYNETQKAKVMHEFMAACHHHIGTMERHSQGRR